MDRLALLLLCWPGLAPAQHRRPRAVTADRGRLWPGGLIPFLINDSYSGDYRRVFQQAMNHWQDQTCLTFVRFDPALHSDHILFTKDKCGCCSHVGRKGGGAQVISIGEDCDKFGIVVHELGHVVGFWHEHTRPDRDEFVRIQPANILPGQAYNFDKARPGAIDSLHETYDFFSIMHYARDTFARPSSDTILPWPRFGARGQLPFIGQRLELSRGDVRQARKLYSCPRCFTTFLQPEGELTAEPGGCRDFVWRVLSSAGQRVRLRLARAHFLGADGPAGDCRASPQLLRVRDGPGLNASVLAEVCAPGPAPLELLSTGAALLLELRLLRAPSAPLRLGTFDVRCGGLLSAAHGFLESPGWPEPHPADARCDWMLRVPAGFRVAVRFHFLQLEPHRDCAYDFVELRENSAAQSAVLGRLCGGELPPPVVTTTSNELLVHFASDSSIQKRGFQLEFVKEVDECVSGAHDCDQLCSNTVGGFSCDCASGFRLQPDGRTCLPSCGGVLDAGPGRISSPNFPRDYPPDQRCVWELRAPVGHQVFLNVLNLTIEGLSSECAYDQLTARPVPAANNSEARLCGRLAGPTLLRAAANALRVEFRSDGSVQRAGFSADFFFDPDECALGSAGCSHACLNTLPGFRCSCPPALRLAADGRTCEAPDCAHQLNEPSGVLESAGFPAPYPARLHCHWHLITTPGHRVLLTFLAFDLEPNEPDCARDSLAVHDGGAEAAPLMARLCGRQTPPRLSSSGNELFLLMRSDGAGAGRGFRASFQSECGGVLTAERQPGLLYSHTGFGDAKYGKSLSCRWELRRSGAAADSVLQLRFRHFALEQDAGCEYDFLEVTGVRELEDGPVRRARLARLCGHSPPAVLYSAFPRLQLHFATDQTDEEKGFVLEYSQVDLTEQVLRQLSTGAQPSPSPPPPMVLNN